MIGELEAQGSFLAREKARVVIFPLRIQWGLMTTRKPVASQVMFPLRNQ